MAETTREPVRLTNAEKETARAWLYDHNGDEGGGLGGLWQMVETILTGRLEALDATCPDPAVTDAVTDTEGPATTLPATGNAVKSEGTDDTTLTVSHGEGNLEGAVPEVHLALHFGEETVVQGWFLLDDLLTALTATGDGDA